MCGIFGLDFKKDSIKEGRRNVLGCILASNNDNRGGHSWGLLNMPLNETWNVNYGIGRIRHHASQVIKSPRLFGHTRFATVGAIKIENCHPFEIGDIVGAHNGGISNYKSLCGQYGRDFQVDSMHIFAHLNEDLPLTELEGYGAIEWVNKKEPEQINLCRFSGGSLSIAGIGKYGSFIRGVVWSSDVNHLTHALESVGLKKDEHYFFYEVNVNQVYFVRNGELYTVGKVLSLKERETIKNPLSLNKLHALSKSNPTMAETIMSNLTESQWEDLYKQEIDS